MMREDKVTVVWLFDESVSLRDDREEIAKNYRRVYEELGIATQQDGKLSSRDEPLLTVVASYGSSLHTHTQRPTSDKQQIIKAMSSCLLYTS